MKLFSMTGYKKIFFVVLPGLICLAAAAQNSIAKTGNDVTTPLHLLQPEYTVPYGKTTIDDISKVLDRVHHYLDATTPAKLVGKQTGKEIQDPASADEEAIFKPGDYRLTSYEWGVTYAGMLLAAEATGDKKYADYTNNRLSFLAGITPYYKTALAKNASLVTPVNSVLKPHALDDAGAMCAAIIKASRAGLTANVRPIIDNFIAFISKGQFRFADGTLARNRPLPNTLWLDDLFMSVPALAQMGKLTGESKYYDDAVKQVLQFSERMFVKEKGLFMHGWSQQMNPHPAFHWARANGWAVMTMVELLDVLPNSHPGRAKVLAQLQAHIKGLASYQSGTGFWHQLLDKNDSYLETSATAIYTYSIARAINRGWIDKKAYGPMVLLAWNAVATKVNNAGQVEGTCVGTGMGFDPAFYYFRPINVFAAHSYGPVLLAGAEMILLLKKHKFEINDSAVQFAE
ncbi:MAG: glycoside hydrolase family 88 protein [Bacteroidota bacterium]